MIRPIKAKDREVYLRLARAFFDSDAVLSPIPTEHITKTFDLLIKGSPFARGYVFEREGQVVGYALLALTWSQEAGGMTVWIEEIYLLPEARGAGLGSEFFHFLEKEFAGTVKRYRLEVEDENEGAVRLYKKLGFDFFAYRQMKKDL